MYDYVLQYSFSKEIQNEIQEIKNYLNKNNIKDKERKWLPHITIDLYNCKNEDEFILKLDSIVKDIQSFNLEFKNLNDFDKETLYIEPYNKEKLLELKEIFNKKLDEYRLEHRKKRTYRPHVTLCTNENIDENTYKLANEKFIPFMANVVYILVYNQDMKLIKEYELK